MPRAQMLPLGSRCVRCALTLALASVHGACLNEGEHCEEIENIPLADDQQAPGGPTGAEVVRLIGSNHQAAFTWQPHVTNADSSTPTQITLSVERTDEPVRFLRSHQVGTSEGALDCGSRLEVPVRLHVTTADGALSEVFETRLLYDTEQGPIGDGVYVFFDLTFSFDEIAGWLRPTGDVAGGSGELGARFPTHEQGLVTVNLDEGNMERTEIAGYWGEPPEI